MNARDRARQLVLSFGWNSTAYQILNPGIEYWFSSRVSAVAGYVPRGNTMVVAGAVCALDELGAVTRELEHDARTQGRQVCYFAAASRLVDHFSKSRRHASIALGAQPVWNPQQWPAILRRRPSLRAQLARARHKGIQIDLRPAASARDDARLRRCLREWLHRRPMPPMRFLVEPDTFNGELADRLILVARQDDAPVAYLLASPVPQRVGYLVEQIIRAGAAPNGAAELLIDGLMMHLAHAGGTFVTLGLVPLCRHADPWLKGNPLWLRALMGWARAHGRRFYNFDGLELFRAKLCPAAWEPIYAICNESHFTPAALHAMIAAFAEGPLAVMAMQALGRTVTEEARRLVGWMGMGNQN